MWIQDGRPSLRLGAPGGSEERDAAHPLTWVPGRYTLEGESVLDVEPYVEYIPVLDDVILPFDTDQALFPRSVLRAGCHEIVA
jgi:hypothetical protein